MVLATSLCLLSPGMMAAPDGGDLLRACRGALANGFTGIEGRMCTWYVTPCDCVYGRKPETPRVCLPEPVTTDLLAEEVVAGLAAQTDLQFRDADVAAAMILSRTYPCKAFTPD